MAWLTKTNLLLASTPRRFAQLTSDDTTGVEDSALITAVIADAEGDVSGAVEAAGRYIPSPAPASCLLLGALGAVHRLLQRRPDSYGEADRLLGESLRNRLRDVREGTVVLEGTLPLATTPADAAVRSARGQATPEMAEDY